MDGVQDKIMSVFRTNATKDCNKPTCDNNVHGGGKKPEKPKTIRRQHNKNLRNLFKLKKIKLSSRIQDI